MTRALAVGAAATACTLFAGLAGQAQGSGPTPADPRVPLVELQLAGRHAEALAAVEALLADGGAGTLGLEYLRGHLEARVGRPNRALQAFAAAMGKDRALAPWARLRLAELQAASGHPEVAAGLLAHLLAASPPAALLPEAVAAYTEALAAGGDCRLLATPLPPLAEPERRRIALARVRCAARAGDLEAARSGWRELLLGTTADDVAWEAALELAPSFVPQSDPLLAGRLGLALYEHRDFARALPFLREALRAAGSPTDRDELAYALARCHFWLGEHREAARRFADVAASSEVAEMRSRARYQQGRALELAGDPAAAAQAFRAAWNLAPTSDWSPLGRLAVLRLGVLGGDGEQAEILRRELADGRPAWREAAGHGAIFLAVTRIAGGADRSGIEELLSAAAAGGRPRSEVAYWRGRLAEARGELRAAVRAYAEAVVADRFHPHAQFARARLLREPLAAYARAHALELARSGQNGGLYAASLLLAADEPRAVAARRTLRRHYEQDRASAGWLELGPLPVPAWPLWRANLDRPEERLAALGLFAEAGSAMMQHFPTATPAAALTGSGALAASGAHQRALYVAEVLARRAPGHLPTDFLSRALRERLYPRAFVSELETAAAEAAVDPHLLAALVREESRFEPRASSGANARGLAQLVLPTAREVAAGLGLPAPSNEDLYRPELSLRLGAHYLGKLLRGYGGGEAAVVAAVAAYNAGELQVEAWRRTCVDPLDAAELASKITFRETREYVARVLASRAHYGELYPPPAR
jgi:soluble lytic murein transglycosylase-like protein